MDARARAEQRAEVSVVREVLEHLARRRIHVERDALVDVSSLQHHRCDREVSITGVR
jgi:hypothetical protein